VVTRTVGSLHTDPTCRIIACTPNAGGPPARTDSWRSDTPAGETIQGNNFNRPFIDWQSVAELVERYFNPSARARQVRLPLSDMFWGRARHVTTSRIQVDVQLTTYPSEGARSLHHPVCP